MRVAAALACWLAASVLHGVDAPADARLSTTAPTLTAHYAIDSDADAALVQRIAAVLEAYHACLTAQFAGHLPPDARRFTVRLCRDRASFLAYGGAHCGNFSRGWIGYYYYGAKAEDCELVIPDLGANDAVLFHEGFHQFMHRAFPAIQAWPQWFNEGLADFFAHGRWNGGVFMPGAISDADQRNLVRDAFSTQRAVPLAELMKLGTQAWNREDQVLHYAEGYLFAQFLATSGEARYRTLISSFLDALSKSQDYDAAFAKTVGALDQKQLQRDFHAFVTGTR